MYTITSAVLIKALHIQTWCGALEYTLVVGTGLLVANTLNIAINPNISRPVFYTAIIGAFHLLGFFIANIITTFIP